ncbi:TPA: low molecular weight phosphotyrosine protein phosphatase [Pasteurella multocida]|nr:low molecular weight phosphotyrosine protein phosphatase [Pasteurella multocida]
MFENILVVCMGNICRSPVGEKLLQQYFPEKSIISAGIVAEESGLVGKTADPQMIQIAKQSNLDISCHLAQQLTPTLCNQAELILVMDKEQIELVHQLCPASIGKVMLFGHWLTPQLEIPDPYKKDIGIYDSVYKKLELAAYQWKQKL